MSFNAAEFHWNLRRIKASPEKVAEAVELLNQLTPAQEAAVRLYGESQREDGYDCGYGD